MAGEKIAEVVWRDLLACSGCNGQESALGAVENFVWLYFGGEGCEALGAASGGGFACVRCAMRCTVGHASDLEAIACSEAEMEDVLTELIAIAGRCGKEIKKGDGREDKEGGICPLCMGILQGECELEDGQEEATAPLLARTVAAMRRDVTHEYKDYAVHSMVPPGCIVRDLSVMKALAMINGGRGICARQGQVVPVRKVVCSLVRQVTEKPFEEDSLFHIRLIMQSPASDEEVTRLIAASGFQERTQVKGRKAKFKERMQAKVQNTGLDAGELPPWGPPLAPAYKFILDNQRMTNQQIAKAVGKLSIEEMQTHGLWPMAVPQEQCSMLLEFEYQKVYVVGRYNKYSRNLPQTAWIFQGKRMAELSVEELIASHIKNLFQADGCVFSASGREDLDVRMLGRGRPFMMEITNARRPFQTAESMAEVEQSINASTDDIRVRDMQTATREQCESLYAGAISKTKQYRCLVWTTERLTDDSFAKLDAVKEGFMLYQQTPVRVLHRRTLAVRERMIHYLGYKKVSAHFFMMDLETQAGTYVKEFVHGDLGRTNPNLGSILGSSHCDILQLDVREVEMEFPPTVPTSNPPPVAFEEIDIPSALAAVAEDEKMEQLRLAAEASTT